MKLQDVTFRVAVLMGEAAVAKLSPPADAMQGQQGEAEVGEASAAVEDKTNLKDDALVLAALVRAWETCQERVRLHRNKPLPGTRRPPPDEPPVKVLKFRNLPPVVSFPRKDTPTNGVQPQLPAPETPQDG